MIIDTVYPSLLINKQTQTYQYLISFNHLSTYLSTAKEKQICVNN